ncbi:MAG: hypothetical protein ACE5IY_17560, partial [bacterium]
MSPQWTSTLGVVFVVLAAVTRVFVMTMTPEDWKGTVNRMVQRDPTWIAGNQVDQIVYFLSERQNIN